MYKIEFSVNDKEATMVVTGSLKYVSEIFDRLLEDRLDFLKDEKARETWNRDYVGEFTEVG